MTHLLAEEARTALTDAFDRKSLAHLSVDFQYGFYNQTFNDAAFRAGKDLSETCRPCIPNIWVGFVKRTARDVPRNKRKWFTKCSSFYIVEPHPGEKTFFKKFEDAFITPDIHTYIKGCGIDTLLVSGVTAKYCIRSTIRSALGLKYNVLPVTDALDITAYASGPAHEGARHLYGNKVLPVTVQDVKSTLEKTRRGGHSP